MMNLIHHHRVHIPNSLAMLAAILLLLTSFYGYQASQTQEAPGQQTVAAASNDTGVSSASEDLVPKKRGLNLGLLLFRR